MIFWLVLKLEISFRGTYTIGIIIVGHNLNETKGCVTHTMALPFTLKSISRAKEELWKL
jgi:hypothetical protein